MEWLKKKINFVFKIYYYGCGKDIMVLHIVRK